MRKTSILIASGIVCTAAVAPMVSALSPVVCTTEYMPVCGQPPMADCPLGKQCVQVMPNPKTYGNACNMRAEGATKIHDGACRGDNLEVDDVRPGADRDEHGCIASAGYMWDSMLEQCVRPWEPQTLFSWAKKIGLTTTKDVQTFNPDATITRDEAAAFLLRASENQILPPQMITPMQYPFLDQDKIAPEFRAAAQFVQNTRIMQGDNNVFAPKNFLTHLEALIVLTRAYEEGEGGVKTNPWYQPYLETAKNVGISFDDSWQTLQKPISRATFMLWMRQYAENFVYDEANTTELPFQGGWKFREFVSSHSNKKIPLPHTVTLEVEGDQMTVQFCNTMHAKVQASGINMLKTSGFASTKMYCEGDQMTLENAFHFTKAYWERLHDDMTLVIKTDAGEFFFDALHTSSKKANLDGNWKLHTYTLAGKTTKKAPENISFAIKNNRITAKVCNHLGADFVLRDSVIETDSFMMTLMYCHDTDLMEIEQAIAFDQAEYKLSSDKKMLTIKTKTGHEFVFQSETK